MLLFLYILTLIACKDHPKKQEKKIPSEKKNTVTYAKGFSLERHPHYTILRVTQPWPGAKKSFTYLLKEKNATIPSGIHADEILQIPVKKIVVTSTTHIPALESLGELSTLVGFPNLNYISSEKARKLIDQKKIKELGKNESLNTEVLLNIQPEVLIGFTMEAGNKIYQTLKKSGIPIVYNGDWTEESPLGKAEWIKFFGAFYNKNKQADSIFNSVKEKYLAAKKIAEKAENEPTVLAGSMYKDVWYLPYGNSWQAQFIKDAHAHYLYRDTKGQGSISLAFEQVLEKAQHANFWVAPGSFTSYQEMRKASIHYQKFDAFQQKKIYSFADFTGKTGGVIFYELGPSRPDLVLKDLIKIFHPSLLLEYQPTFYNPLN